MTIHYFVYGSDFAAVEDADRAVAYRDAGWHPASRAEFIAAWRARDLAGPPPPLERAVADVAAAGVPGSVRLVPVKY